MGIIYPHSFLNPTGVFIKLNNTDITNFKNNGINLNLNLFLKLLGATNDIICDDQKTLEFMFDIKKKLEEAYGEIKSTLDLKHEE